MDVDTALKYYDTMVKDVFSHPKGRPAQGRFKATRLEAAIKSIVRNVTGDSDRRYWSGISLQAAGRECTSHPGVV